MIAVVGVPAWRAAEPSGPGGRACDVAIAAARRGARVELVGRAGDDRDGDAVLMALSQAGVGHAAVLRDPVRATPVIEWPPADESLLDAESRLDAESMLVAERVRAPAPSIAEPGPLLDPADVALGLSYVDAFSVLVVTDDVPAGALPAAVEAAAYAGAQLVVIIPPGRPTPAVLPADATVLAAPDEADDGEFATLVGEYAAALDGGMRPAEAFAAATRAAGWEALDQLA
ncbi:MAG TPA: PfkB family carbohydrate kinase [Candidatus Limnocylindrales bacterium]